MNGLIKAGLSLGIAGIAGIAGKKFLDRKDSIKNDSEILNLVEELSKITNTPKSFIWDSLKSISEDYFPKDEQRTAILAGLQARLYFEKQKRDIMADMKNGQEEAQKRVIEMTNKLAEDMLKDLY